MRGEVGEEGDVLAPPLDEGGATGEEEGLVAADSGGSDSQRFLACIRPVAGEQTEDGGGVGCAAAKTAGGGNAFLDADTERFGLAPECLREGVEGAPGEVSGVGRGALGEGAGVLDRSGGGRG